MTEPLDLADLRARAERLAGKTLNDIAAELYEQAPTVGLHTKGKVGELIERALGATGGSHATHDFPGLAVELKTVPVDARLRPRESTYVCRISMADAERAEWADSWVRRKLSHVLFVPIVDGERVATPVFWKPSAEEERALRADFDELMGMIGMGRIEDLTARDGEILQLRPKARDGSVRTTTWDRDGELIATVPRGFYLRARFTASLLTRRSRASAPA
jgi:DNA mismatch repair protein MutH